MWGANAVDSAFKFYKRAGIYKASNVEFNPKTMEATSYGWWTFVRKIKGKVIFNDYYYSNSTSGHQSKVKKVLRDLKIKIDVKVNTRADLSNLSEGLAEKYRSMFEQEMIIAGKARPATKVNSKFRIVVLKKDIATLRAIGATLPKVKIASIKREVIADEEQRLLNNRECRKQSSSDKPRISNDAFAKRAMQFELVV